MWTVAERLQQWQFGFTSKCKIMEWWIKLSEIVRNFGIIVGSALALLIAWQRARAATRQASAANDSHFQDVFASAIANLGSRSLSVRTGGVVALTELANSEPKYRDRVRGILTGFVRTGGRDDLNDELPPDLQDALYYLRIPSVGR